ncbi:MAG: ribosome silencing factor [Clostridia bacterium]|nr:ribosome silencing factor [Clostridia bacterium]
MYLSDEEYAALPSLKDAEAEELAKALYEILDEKKAKDIKILHVAEQTVLCEYFVICTGTSSTQIRALAGELEHRTALRGLKPYHVEDKGNKTWVCADYSSVIVHIFSPEARTFYNLEKLYADAVPVRGAGEGGQADNSQHSEEETK